MWPTFGPKVGPSILIEMKLEVGVWHCLLNVYTGTKFQTGVLKHVEKITENFKNSKSRNKYLNDLSWSMSPWWQNK